MPFNISVDKPFKLLRMPGFERNEVMFNAFISCFSEPTAPQNLRGFNISSTQLNLTWDEPKRRNGKLTSYTLYYKRIKDDSNQNVPSLEWQSNSTTFPSAVLIGLGENNLV